MELTQGMLSANISFHKLQNSLFRKTHFFYTSIYYSTLIRSVYLDHFFQDAAEEIKKDLLEQPNFLIRLFHLMWVSVLKLKQLPPLFRETRFDLIKILSFGFS